MKINKFSSMVAALAMAVCFSSATMAQQQNGSGQVGTQRAQVQALPAISPSPSGQPRLGFMGQMIHGYGMRILHTNYGSPAAQAGLESGDIIMSINNHRVLSQWDYNQALRNAAMYNNGFVTMKVRNVRFDYGQSYQQFVFVSTRVIGGFGGGYPAYGAPQPYGGGAVQGGVIQSGVVGGAQQRQGQQRQRQVRSSDARPKVKEINADQIPKMVSGQKGSAQ